MFIHPDCFSKSQIFSKRHMVDYLNREHAMGILSDEFVVWYLGGWHGMGPFMILYDLEPICKVRSFDIDPDCEAIADQVCTMWKQDDWRFKAFTQDVNELKCFSTSDGNTKFGPVPDVVVNTSCEHMENDWYARVPHGVFVMLQGSDLDIDQHTHRIDSLDMKRERYPMMIERRAEVLEFDGFNRYCLYGVK